MHTNSVRCRLLADLMHTNSVLLCRIFADLIIPILCCADYSQTLCTHCAEQISVNQNVAAAARAAGAHRGRQAPASCAKPHRFARDGEAAAREGEAAALEGEAAARKGETAAREGDVAAREGEAAAREGDAAAREGDAVAREGEAGGSAAREGEAVRLSALEVVLPAATAAPRASGIQ